MNLDTIVLTVKSVVSKMTNDLKESLNQWKQYDNETSKVATSLNKVASANKTVDNSFKASKQNVDDMVKKLKEMESAYKSHLKAFEDRPSGFTKGLYNPQSSSGEINPDNAKIISQKSLDEELQQINEYKSILKELGYIVDEQSKKSLPKGMVPKEVVDNTKKLGDSAKDTTNKINKLVSAMSRIGGVAKTIGSKGFGFLKSKFSGFSKDLGRNVDSNLKHIKKLALGFIGVRTAMSVLTKSVGAYLSFDSELQDSLTNSWNMLGSLLAPAIEFVARAFAIATNYVAQFVNALTGINLVARANAKALQTQAKAQAKANEAQRGLLGMDEITNLPTEPGASGGSGPNLIQMDDSIKSFKELDKILKDLKEGKWHEVGEDIADGINKLLYSINWDKIKTQAYNLGYNFADFLNGLFEVDWSKIGNTMAETLNTWVELVKGFVDKFSFVQFGDSLGDMLNHLFLDFNWDEAAQTINTAIQGIGDAISTFLTTFKWGEIGEKFGEFVKNIDWGNLLFQAIKISILAFSGFAEFLANFLVALFGDIIEPVKEPLLAFGNFIYEMINGVFERIADVVSPIIDFLAKNFKHFVDGIKSLLKGDLLGAVKSVGKGIANAFILPINVFIGGLNAMIKPIKNILQVLADATGLKINFKDAKIPKIPLLETGTPKIESEGLYHLHEGEMVVPKRYNPNTDGYDNGKDNRQIIDLLIALNTNLIDYANRPIDINMNSRKVAEAIYDDTQFLDSTRNKSTAVVRS